MSRSAGSTKKGGSGRNTTRPCSSSGTTLATEWSDDGRVACEWLTSRLTVLLRRPTATAADPARYRRYPGLPHPRLAVSSVSAPSPTRGVLPSASAFPVAHALWRAFRASVWCDLPRIASSGLSVLYHRPFGRRARGGLGVRQLDAESDGRGYRPARAPASTTHVTTWRAERTRSPSTPTAETPTGVRRSYRSSAARRWAPLSDRCRAPCQYWRLRP